ncbi:HAD family hydrolase [Candidatus Parcubacteria bacterium]|nr:MAG: HAD family hydrolase [Candidatus Parcubacteria bacterium]
MVGLLRVLILDFDGVVIESNAVKTEAFQHVFARFPEHAETMMTFHHANVSLSRFAKFEHLLALMGRTDDAALMANIAADFSRRVTEGMMSVPLVHGAETFFHKVTPRLPVYLASVTPAKDLAWILAQRGLAHWFREVYGCPPWTKPAAIRDVLTREGVKPGNALLIGDSYGDQRAAQMTGIDFLARDSGLNFDAPTPLIFADLNEISEHIEGLLP